jgi:TonB-dependent SusC/RagA subfamily outer membrane receptor
VLANTPLVLHCGRAGTQQPLYYVVDGRLYDPGSMAAMKGVDPADIETIEVMKGAAAAAMYGRGAATHGVIIITTRKAGKSRAHPASARSAS